MEDIKLNASAQPTSELPQESPKTKQSGTLSKTLSVIKSFFGSVGKEIAVSVSQRPSPTEFAEKLGRSLQKFAKDTIARFSSSPKAQRKEASPSNKAQSEIIEKRAIKDLENRLNSLDKELDSPRSFSDFEEYPHMIQSLREDIAHLKSPEAKKECSMILNRLQARTADAEKKMLEDDLEALQQEELRQAASIGDRGKNINSLEDLDEFLKDFGSPKDKL